MRRFNANIDAVEESGCVGGTDLDANTTRVESEHQEMEVRAVLVARPSAVHVTMPSHQPAQHYNTIFGTVARRYERSAAVATRSGIIGIVLVRLA
jgi:hypothetical protein